MAGKPEMTLNTMFKALIGTTPQAKMYGFRDKAYVYLDWNWRQKGKIFSHAWEGAYLWLEQNTSTWCFFNQEKNGDLISNQATFDKHIDQFRKTKVIDQFLEDNSSDILYRTQQM